MIGDVRVSRDGWSAGHCELLDNRARFDDIIIDFSKAFHLVPHVRLLTEIAVSGVELRVVEWIRDFILGHMESVRVGGQLSEEVRVTSGVPRESVLGLLLFVVT